MRRTIALVILGLVAVACGPAEDGEADDSTTTEAPQTATTQPVTTTTQSAPDGPPILATPVVGVLQPSSPGGEALFPPGSVEAHWYHWNDFYVVLYRGFDASSGDEICAGNSINVPGLGFTNISNSPHIGSADQICVGVPKIAGPPSGVRACGSLLYYLTEIGTNLAGDLYGTLEIGTASGFDGQTSAALSDLASTPPFEPDLLGYDLPASDVDPGGVVTCDG